LFSKLLLTPQETVVYAVELATELADTTSLTSTKLMRDMLLYGPNNPEETHILDSKVFLSVVGSKDNVAGIKGFMKNESPRFGGAFDGESVPFWSWWKPENDGHLNAKL
jgi:hypothetical protein